ncbi:hypothetical protein SAICODRAFT_22472 [Saitoella complicata NRRL Y-17804]|uniref:Inclusion body clearance protein IML2 n=1 Tax=Saitoella complicata (strain BCRC 22490 / CBS 7301 / JCM 7358 / NBRC 10748 / NRRL Y-17804) TaxID=698492 RepID=A0A0E9NJ25_SAICN|nr:uncharacterized protein SAICODRAFT_22472 [Saitoella complicata NRRL Y-17804]ODQ56044.1 hypothetical protein SAICODRAFT_22472 [Saitoella complicata NRRL Y-17804]GAO49390.1 hypothetical protein G7K_3540-t1 [Saitoella complicata NRRL Y-17804]
MFKKLWGSSASTPASSTNLKLMESSEEDREALRQTLAGMDALMNDQLDEADRYMNMGSSVYHMLGRAAVQFLKGIIGGEQEILKAAGRKVLEAEAAADKEQRKAIAEGRPAGKYPPGTEFSLVRADALLMSSLVGFTTESMVESMKAAFNIRKAYGLFAKNYEIITGGQQIAVLGAAGVDGTAMSPEEESETVNALTDATQESLHLHHQPSNISIKTASSTGSKRRNTKASPAVDASFRGKEGDEQMNGLIYAGTLSGLGIFILIISLLPTSLNKILSIIGFRGDRKQALQLLWDSAPVPNVYGAIATLTLLEYYNAISSCDIVDDELFEERRKTLEMLALTKVRYPKSGMWGLQETRAMAQQGKLYEALDRLEQPMTFQMKQVEVLWTYEHALNLLYALRFEEAAQKMLHLSSISEWSHAIYTFFAGCCYVELYRQALLDNDTEAAARCAKEADALLTKVPGLVGKKTFMSKPMPLEVFVQRKIKRWQARVGSKGQLVDGVGVSPLMEFVWINNGWVRMASDKQLLEKSQRMIKYRDASKWQMEDDADEMVVRDMLTAVVMRYSGDLRGAREILEQRVVHTEKAIFYTSKDKDEYCIPGGYYELAVCLWEGQKEAKGAAAARQWLIKARDYGQNYDIANRVDVRIQAGLSILKKYP